MVPLLVENQWWGLLIAHQCKDFRSWQSDELELLDRIAVQLAIAIQQAITYQRAQQELAERKRAEIALQRSEAVQRAIIESIPDLLILVDRRGQYQAILSGGAVQEILRPDPQIEQPTVHHVLPQDLADRRMVAIEQAFLTKTIQIYEQPIKLNGQLCWEEVRVTRVGDELALVMVRDITERKQAEATLQQLNQELESAIERRTAALRESEQRFRQIFEQSPVGIAISDLAGKLVRVNSSLAEMMGCTHAQLQQRSIQQLLQTGRQPEEIPQLQQLLEQTLTVISFEKQPVTPDGKTLWVNVTSALLLDGFGHPSGMIHLVNDITERKQAEEQLNWTLKELSDFKYALDQAAIVAITDQNGVISYANERFCEISQYSKSELIGQSHKIVSSSYHPPEFFAQLWKTIAQGQVWRGEIRNRAKDGSHYWVDSTIVPFLDDQGQPLQYLAIRTDITDRKQTEALLRSSEARLRIAQRIANLGSWEIDLQTLTITWSQESFTIFGRDPETGTPSYEEFRAFIHPDDLAYHDEVLTQALAQGQPLETEYRFYWPDRTLRHIQSRGEPIFDEKGNLRKFVGTVLDITQRKEAEEQLRNLSDRLSRAVNSGNMGIWEWDIPQDRLIWDEQMYRLYGTQKHDFHLTYQAWTHGLHLEDRPAAEACIQQALKGEGEFDTEFRVVHPDGSIHFLKASGIVRRNEQGEPQQMVGINFDITDRRLAEENLKRQLSAIEAAIDGIAILKGDIFTYLNPAHLTMFGYQQIEDLMGQPWHSLYSPEERNRLEQEVFPALVEQGFWQGEATAIRQDGTTFTEGISLTLTENGEIICVCRDITLQKQAEQNLRQANTQLILANAELHRVTRLKDEFLANMSHELRTPLNAILGMSEGLQDMVFGPLNDRASRAVQTIEQSGKHLLELINDILDLSKVEAGKLELQTAPVAIRYLCDSSLTFVRQQAIKKNIQLLLSIPPDLPNIVVDERRIRQVLMNLLNNAIKFTPTGGQVELSVQTPGQEGQDFLLFSIRDTGIGIAPEEQHRLFQPFVQIDSSLNREHSGTGLGLALVRRLVELHQGTVSLKSVVGKGSCFTIHLPYHLPQPAPNSRDPISINSPGVIQNHRVLVIEDSQAAAEQVSWYLEELGMHPSIYHQGEGALKQALQLQPGLIFVDVQLPDLSGWQVLTQLKQHPQTQQVPVIVVSVMEERSRGLALGASDYLVKPLSREQLRKTLMQLGYTPGVSRPSALNSPPVSHPRLMAPRLLLAEDNEANVATISSYLKAKGYQIQVATNGREALLKAQEEVPDLILMDIQMPEVDGLTAIAQMRADSSLASIAIIALTALAMPGDREKCLAMGANEYLTKPIRLKHLADVIQNLLDKGQPFISRVDTQASNPEN